jgi:hypothetical protein
MKKGNKEKSVSNNEGGKWKSRLLSSSIPLEYEVAKILVKNTFSVNFDYSYKRKDDSAEKDFSVDVKGYGFCPFSENKPINAEVTVIAECKYRVEGTKWLFIPDIDTHTPKVMGNVIRAFDLFSKYHYDRSIITPSLFEFTKLPTCLKGVEVNITSGEVHETGIVHGISQLKYALPQIIHDEIENTLWANHVDDTHPFFIIPLLVTTADLYILNKNATTKSIKDTSDLKGISRKVPYLKLYSNTSPDFRLHLKNVFNDFDYSYEEIDRLNYFENLRIFSGGELFAKTNDGNKYISMSQQGLESESYKGFIICTFSKLDELIKLLRAEVARIVKSGIDLSKCSVDKKDYYSKLMTQLDPLKGYKPK